MTVNPAKVFLFKGFFPSTERIWFFYVWYALQKFYEVFVGDKHLIESFSLTGMDFVKVFKDL